MSKKDLLKECMTDVGQQIPLPEFTASFCDFCLQSECTRSQSGKSLFEKRVSSWEERLFKNPKELPKDDPRYREIAAQRFIDSAAAQGVHLPVLGRAQIPSQQSWVDPRDLEQPEPTPPAPAQSTTRVEPEPEPEKPEKSGEKATKATKKVDKDPEPEPVENTQDLEEKEAPPQKVTHVGSVNTPFQPGAMVGSESQSSKAPPKDAWDAPQSPLEPGVKVLKPGGKFRFGNQG